jgi:hypothetical protein
MVIAAYPFETEDNLAVFDKDGKSIQYEIAEDS